MCIKIDKPVVMNVFYSILGGIFGGIWVANSLGQTPLKGTSFSLFWLFIEVFVIGILLMGFVNYYIPKDWHIGKQFKRISKKAKQ